MRPFYHYVTSKVQKYLNVQSLDKIKKTLYYAKQIALKGSIMANFKQDSAKLPYWYFRQAGACTMPWLLPLRTI